MAKKIICNNEESKEKLKAYLQSCINHRRINRNYKNFIVPANLPKKSPLFIMMSNTNLYRACIKFHEDEPATPKIILKKQMFSDRANNLHIY